MRQTRSRSAIPQRRPDKAGAKERGACSESQASKAADWLFARSDAAQDWELAA